MMAVTVNCFDVDVIPDYVRIHSQLSAFSTRYFQDDTCLEFTAKIKTLRARSFQLAMVMVMFENQVVDVKEVSIWLRVSWPRHL
jgi:hypothetical protein